MRSPVAGSFPRFRDVASPTRDAFQLSLFRKARICFFLLLSAVLVSSRQSEASLKCQRRAFAPLLRRRSLSA
jgi:hypothetical protein